MRKLLLLFVAAAALAGTGAGIAGSSAGPNDQLAGQVRIYGGGEFGPGCFTGDTGLCFPDKRSLAVDAHVDGNGNGAAYGSLEYGSPGKTDTLVRITCVNVNGNSAILGGIVTESWNPAFVGLAVIYYVVDNGSVDSATPDQASPANLDPIGAADWPADFPYTCPSTPPPAAPAVYQDLRGDIVVQGPTP
jgi:hypothetical protein